MEPKRETHSPARQYIPLDMSILSGRLRVVHVHLLRRVADVTNAVMGGRLWSVHVYERLLSHRES
jgi:hypothetical protein